MNVTEIRRELRRSVQEKTMLTDSSLSVRLGPSKYGVARSDSDEMNFIVTVMLDKAWAEAKYPMDEPEEILDRWLNPGGDESIKQHLEADFQLKDLVAEVSVTRTSGHRLYQDTPDGPPRSGAEWTVRTLA